MHKKLAVILILTFIFTSQARAQVNFISPDNQVAPPATTQPTTAQSATDTQKIDQIKQVKSEGFTMIPANPNTINAGRFIFEIKPGSQAEDHVIVRNLADVESKFLLYGADPTLSAQGTPAYKTRQNGGNAEGSWIKFDEPEILLAPNESKLVRFTVTVPAGTSLGDYRAGISMEKTKQDINNPNFIIATRLILHADIKVTSDPKPVPKQGPEANLTSLNKSPTNWQTIYFWISLAFFIISLVALILVSLYERKRRKIKLSAIASHKTSHETPHKTSPAKVAKKTIKKPIRKKRS